LSKSITVAEIISPGFISFVSPDSSCNSYPLTTPTVNPFTSTKTSELDEDITLPSISSPILGNVFVFLDNNLANSLLVSFSSWKSLL